MAAPDGRCSLGRYFDSPCSRSDNYPSKRLHLLMECTILTSGHLRDCKMSQGIPTEGHFLSFRRFGRDVISSGINGRRVDLLVIRADQSIVISLYICFSGLQNGARFIRNDFSFVSSHLWYFFLCHFVKFGKSRLQYFDR